MRAAGPYFWLIGLSSLYEQVFTLWLRVDATIYFRIYGLLDMVLMLYFYSQVVKGQRAAIWLFGLAYSIVFIYLWIHFDEYDLTRADQICVPISTFIVFYFTILWFRQQFLAMREESLLSMGSFYFVSGLFMYFAATIFLFLYSNLVFKSKAVNYLLEFWVFNIFMVILARLIFIIAIWKGRRT